MDFMKRCFWKIVIGLSFGISGTLILVGQSETMEPFIVEASPQTNIEEMKPTGEVNNIDSPSLTSPIEDAEDSELKALKKEREKLMLENQLEGEKLKKELFELKSERERLSLENGLQREQMTKELTEIGSDVQRLKAEYDFVSKRTALTVAQKKEELDSELMALRAEEERLKLRNSIAAQEVESQLIEIRLKDAGYKIEKAKLETEVSRLQGELIKIEKSDLLADQVTDSDKYTLEPYGEGGKLSVSDRRIALNGPIWQQTADYVAERIDYYNNKNTEYPIFLVIDYSPGGSTMAGYQILKSMEGSEAPVYVVLKSFAASMAAAIVTLAEKSFAYPNAVILHHQISWANWGNLTQQRESLGEAEEWWRRLAEPIAAKMDLSLNEFIAEMYKKSSDGDWKEFADEAQRLKWVDELVSQIWETSYDKNPDRFGPASPHKMEFEEKVDEKGETYMILPRLRPFDFYYLYNPDAYYRLK
jgi:ATP-dependent Clp protease protease subunit